MHLLVPGKGLSRPLPPKLLLITGAFKTGTPVVKKIVIVMKLTAIFLLVAALHVSARVYPQRVSISGKQLSLSQVFEEIQQQTGYALVVNKSLLKKTNPVSLNVQNATLQEVLDKCLKEQGLSYQISNKIIVITSKQADAAQQRSATTLYYQAAAASVHGRVLDEKGNPLQGVSVRLKGRPGGTVSDEKGEFTLTIPEKEILVFEYVGYATQELDIAGMGNNLPPVHLKPLNASLDDLVVVGYGTQKKTNLTGAVSVVSKEVMENRPVTNSVAALQGAAPGLVVTRSSGQPGQEGYNMNIRGLSSLNGTNGPLVVIDGVAGGDLSLLNPYDIESISVLKDASAAAIYGAQASGGVILVTTKKGVASNKLKLEYTGLYTTNTRYNVPNLLHSWEAALMVDSAYANAGMGGGPWPAWKIRVMKSDTAYLPTGTNLGVDPPVIPSDYTTYDYYHELDPSVFLRNRTYSQNHNVTASGGNDKMQYLFGLGYYTQNGVFTIGPDAYKRYNARFNTNIKLNRILSIDSRLSYVFSKTLASVAGSSIGGDNGVLYNLYSRAGSGVQTGTIFFPSDKTGTKLANASGGDMYGLLRDGGYNNTNLHTLSGVFTLKADNLVKGLSLRLIYSPGLQQNNNIVFAKNFTLWSTEMVPVSVSASGGVVNGSFGNSLAKARITQYTHDVQALADYSWQWKTDHSFHVLGGFEYRYYNYDNENVKATNLVSTNTPSLNFTSATSVVTAGDNIQTNSWVSYFGRFNYAYRNKYLLELNLRDDGSSKLAPGHRYQLFPSVSAGWRMAQENWFKDAVPFVNEFKLRSSYGSLGNAILGADNTNNYSYVAALSQGASTVFNNVNNYSYYQAALPSPGKGWETIKTLDFGTDIALLRNRLNISFDYFKRNNNNMLITINYPATLGVGAPTSNSASMETKGWDLTIGWADKINKNLSYWINANLSDNTNKLTKYDGTITVSAGVNNTIVGMPIGSIFGYIDDGYFKDASDVAAHAFQYTKTGPGDIKYRNLDGSKYANSSGRDIINGGANTLNDHGDLAYLGNTNPRYSFGVNLGFSYKWFDISAIFQGVGKRQMLIPSRTTVPFVQTYRTPWREQMDYWTPTHTDARFPRLFWYGSDVVAGAMNAAVSSHWVQNASYLSLKNLQVGYTVPQKLFQKMRVFFSAQDIWRITGMWYKSFDAENPNNNAWNYPFFRSYAAGLNVNF